MNETTPSPDEETIRRLVQAGMGPEARPPEALKVQTLERLRAEQRRLYPAGDFPLPALGLLLMVLAGLGAWLASRVGDPASLSQNLVSVLLGINLVWIPIASFVIVQRRRHVPHR